MTDEGQVWVEHTRKVVVVGYDTNTVKGAHATVLAARPDGAEVIEKKQVVNRGHAALSFPSDYHGQCHVVIKGSRSGEVEHTIAV